MNTTALDHLVVWARTLEEGAGWCQSTLGVTPQTGGQHPLMGTHNLLLNITGLGRPRAYLEIIAIQPGVTPGRAPGDLRWFDMDNPRLQQHIAEHGPQLVHWVARVPHIQVALTAWQARGLDSGPALAASRATPTGELRWQIAVRPDGQRLMDGAVPTPIEWGEQHPTDNLPPSPVHLTHWQISHPDAPSVQAALAAIGLNGLSVAHGPARLQATLTTPKGPVLLSSPQRAGSST